MVSTASSPRSPLGSAWTHGQPRHRRRLGPAGQHGQLELAVPAAGHLRTRPPCPAPSVRSTPLPGPQPATVAACRPSAPDSTIRSPASWPARPGRPAAASQPGPTRRRPGRARPRSAAVEGVAQPGEEALLAGRELAGRRSSPRSLASSPQQLLLLGVELGRGLHGHVDEQVAAAGRRSGAGRRGRTAGWPGRTGCRAGCRPPRGRPGSRACTSAPSAAAVIGIVHRAVQVVAVPLEDRVRPLDDLQEQVAGRAAAGADLALAGELDVGAVLDTGRDPDLERAAGADPAVAGALRAGAADHGAEAAAAAGTAGRS